MTNDQELAFCCLDVTVDGCRVCLVQFLRGEATPCTAWRKEANLLRTSPGGRMARYNITWYFITGYNITWYNITWYNITWFNITWWKDGKVQYHLVVHHLIQYHLVQSHGTITWYYITWYDITWWKDGKVSETLVDCPTQLTLIVICIS